MVGIMFSSRWWKTTFLVLVAVGVMVRLGIWQLDRLEQRRAFNARVNAQLEQSPLQLDSSNLTENLEEMEYRQVVVVGEYDHSHEVVLRNQAMNNAFGVHILTPLRISGTDTYILVNRGWVPMEDFTAGELMKYNELGVVEVRGMIRRSQERADFGRRTDPTIAPGETQLDAWHLANVVRIGEQVPFSLLAVYIQQAPDPSWTGMPYRSLPQLELTEGSHLGYALQWFTFAAILGLGYPIFVMKEDAGGRPRLDGDVPGHALEGRE
jgi:surfeit locus 1 family protein